MCATHPAARAPRLDCFYIMLSLVSATLSLAPGIGHRCNPRPVVVNSRAVRIAAIIEPSLYQECAIYDADMEKSMNDLQEQLAAARTEASAAEKRLSRLESSVDELKEQNDKQKNEAESLQIQLEKAAGNADANRQAALRLEKETSRLLTELDSQGVQHSEALQRETTALKAQIDLQSEEANSAKENFERAEREKRRLRNEMDRSISEAALKAADAQAAIDTLSRDLAQSKDQNNEYLAAIERIAQVAKTVQETRTKNGSTNL